MKPALAKTPEPNALEHLGSATVQIVHDLKNQLNGLKLYATFLRKRLERDDRAAQLGAATRDSDRSGAAVGEPGAARVGGQRWREGAGKHDGGKYAAS